MEKEQLTKRLTIRLSDEHYKMIKTLPDYLCTEHNQSNTIRILLQAVYARLKEQESLEHSTEGVTADH